MNRLCWLTACAALLAGAGGHAQIFQPTDINYFGGDFPKEDHRAADVPPAPAGYSQALVFQDGRELRGELAAITGDEVLWQRSDVSEPLRFPRSEVRRIATDAALRDSLNHIPDGLMAAREKQDGKEKSASAKPIPATLKLPGGDWLFGDVASADGQSFKVHLEDGTQLVVDRARIEWMQFGKAPTPALGFSGSVLDMEGWSPAATALELAGETLTVQGTSWIGRRVAPPKRFELSFELPESGEEGLALWLQPFAPQPHCYSPGTVEMRFDRKSIAHSLFVTEMKHESDPLPVEALNDKGPVNYRVFYDGAQRRTIVLRNGRQVGDWKFVWPKDDPQAEMRMRNFEFHGLCFERENRGQGETLLQFRQLRFQPWDGILPKEGEADDGQDRLGGGEAAPLAGKLESVIEQELGFSGAPHARQVGAFVRFAGPPRTGLAGAEARVEFGNEGAFSVRHLEVHDGQLRGESSFAAPIHLPLAALHRIIFPRQAPPAPSPVDLLVFKNGDELAGKALSAKLHGPVRWRTAQGQEVEFQPGRVAGLRLASAGHAAAAPAAAILELRTGERLRGRLLELDAKQIRLEHPQFGAIALDRSRLWRLFPNPPLGAIEGGETPGGWPWVDPAAPPAGKRKKSADASHWVFLDGTYLVRGQADYSSFDTSELPGWQHAIDPAFERFELRMQAAAPFGALPNFFVTLTGKDETQFTATINDDALDVNVVNNRANRGGHWREIPFREKLGNSNPARALRLLVDTRAGTCDVFLNGVHLARLGKDEGDRLPKTQYNVRLEPDSSTESAIFSNIWIGPWNGELPPPVGIVAGTTALANGDVVPAIPKTIREGKLLIDSELGELAFPVGKVAVVDFGGAMEALRAAARLRLVDGTTVNVDEFQWDDRGLAAHSATLGDLHVPLGAVAELVYAPAAPQTPLTPEPKKAAQNEAQPNPIRE